MKVACDHRHGHCGQLGAVVLIGADDERSAARAKNSLRETPNCFAARSTRRKVSSGSEIAVFIPVSITQLYRRRGVPQADLGGGRVIERFSKPNMLGRLVQIGLRQPDR